MHAAFTYVYLFALFSSIVQAMPISPFHHRRHQKRDANPKTVVAHHMVGNTYPYTQDDWETDIKMAHAAGIDAFALNIGSDDWQPKQVASAYQAAQASGTDFKLFISFDMTVLPCGSPDDAAAIRKYITDYAQHPNQLKYSGRSFASTFSGEKCSFGAGSPQDGWKNQFTQHGEVTAAGGVHFVPCFFVDPATFGQYSGAAHGMFNWNSAWPISLTAQTAQQTLGPLGSSLISTISSSITQVLQSLAKFVGATDTDTQYVNGLKALQSDDGSTTYMGSVSPWFFTHYGADTFNKNWIYYADSHLYPTRWENIVEQRDMFDMVEIITWNDYGESHYIGPIKGAQPMSNAWVDGFDHTAWLDMTSYFATGYKTGQYPAVTEDKIYLWARPHPADANSPDPVGKPDNFQLGQDVLWAVVFATAPGTVILSTSDSTSQDFPVTPGVNKLSMLMTPGGYMAGRLVRDGQTVVDLHPKDFQFNPNPQTYNYNAFTAFAGSGSTGADVPPPPPASAPPAPASSSVAEATSATPAPAPSSAPTDTNPAPSSATVSASSVPSSAPVEASPAPASASSCPSSAPADASPAPSSGAPAGTPALPVSDLPLPTLTLPTGSSGLGIVALSDAPAPTSA